jgi:PAS domain S-box-containing protein
MIIPQKADSARRRYFLLSLAIVVSGMALSVVGWRKMRAQERTADAVRFERTADRLMGFVRDRLITLEMALRSERALFEANTELERSQWESFTDGVLPLIQDYVAGLTYVERVPRERLPAFLARAKADYGTGFSLTTSGDRPELYVVRHARSFHYPLGLGLDLATDQTRSEALERAMVTGTPVLTKHTFLLLENTRRPACLLYIPVYSKGVAPATPEDRRERLRGWVSGRIRFDEIINNWNEYSGNQLDYEIYDGRDVISSDTFVLANTKPLIAPTLVPSIEPWLHDGRLVGFRHVDLYGHGTNGWTVCFIATPSFDAAGSHAFATTILIGGTIVSLLSGWVFWSMGTRKSRAQELAEAEAHKLSQIASRTNNAVIIVDNGGKVDWVNQSFTRITGFSPVEAQDCEAVKFVTGPQTDPALAEEIRQSLQLGHAFRKEVLNQNKAGRHYWIDLEIQAVRDPTGRLLYNLIIGIDVTERKQAEQELARKEAQFRFIFDSAPVGLAWTIVDHPESRVVNKAHTNITGVSLEAAQSDPDAYRKVTYREDQAKQDELTARLTRGEIDVMSLEKRYLRPNGDIVWAMLTLRRFPDLHTGQIHEVTTIVDVTEPRRQTDALRVAMKAAEQANIAKSQFLAMMSHEIRTPMNGVIGMTSILLDSPLTPEQREFADTIHSSGDALLAIINDILDFSKIEAGRLDLEKEVFSLGECVEGTFNLVSANAAKKGLDLLHQIAADAPGLVRGDANRLRQILVNLLNNALKFTERGEVVLTLATAAVGPGAVELHFAVRDTGIGIPAAAMERLFRSFSQVDASTTRKYGGTGLGLVISQRLAELMGGRMWAESEEGKGSTFHFTIRAEVVSSKPAPCLGGVRTHLAGKRVLIVDDNSTNRRILSTLVQKWNLVPRMADSAAAALQLIDSGETFDVGIVDMQMPGMDGVMFGHEVRKRSRSEKLPLILLSSVGRRNDIPEGLFVIGLAKPVRDSEIFDAITGIFPGEDDKRKSTRPPEPIAVAPAAVPTRSERILLVEDNVVNQRVALQMLARLGYRADVAANGAEALSAVHRQRYDIVLMDVQMPEMDGLESTKRMMKEFPLRQDRPWIIALTANAMQGDRELCLLSGMDDYISKPLRPNELSAALGRIRIAVAS